MNIIFYRYGSICEPDFIASFEKVGLTVKQLTREIKEKEISAETRIHDIVTAIKQEKFIFVFTVNFFPYISDICEHYQVPYVCWSVDNPVMELHDKAVKNSCNRIFLFDHAQYEQFAPFHPQGIFYLPLATNVQRWDNVRQSITLKDKKMFANNLSFVGSLYEKNQPLDDISLSPYMDGYLAGVIKAQQNIYGCNIIEDLLSEPLIKEIKTKSDVLKKLYSNIRVEQDNDKAEKNIIADHYIARRLAHYERVDTLNTLAQMTETTLFTHSDCSKLNQVRVKAGVQTLTEMPKVFSLSNINLNITIKSIRTGLPLRIWDIIGCGGFMLSNFQTELLEYFTLGEEIEAYSSLEELQDKVAYYSHHEDVRNAIAQKGYEKVKQYHTYDHRIVTMLDMITKSF